VARFRSAARVALFVLLSATALACLDGPSADDCAPAAVPNLERSDLVGVYSGTDVGALALNADGTFTATGLWDVVGANVVTLGGSGTWVFTEDPDHLGDISLDFMQTDGQIGPTGRSLDASGSRDEPWIWYDWASGCGGFRLDRAPAVP
jgi:hypothetical protein